jgi:hypothetical protein
MDGQLALLAENGPPSGFRGGERAFNGAERSWCSAAWRELENLAAPSNGAR